MAKRDSKWKNLATVSIQHAMSVDAPTFKPNTASASLSPVRMPMLGPNENQEILKQNIAHMYKYYNDLIYRQNDGTTKFDKAADKPTIVDLKRYGAECVNPPPGVVFVVFAAAFGGDFEGRPRWWAWLVADGIDPFSWALVSGTALVGIVISLGGTHPLDGHS